MKGARTVKLSKPVYRRLQEALRDRQLAEYQGREAAQAAARAAGVQAYERIVKGPQAALDGIVKSLRRQGLPSDGQLTVNDKDRTVTVTPPAPAQAPAAP